MNKLYVRLKDFVIRRIIGVEDTPQRIAWGVFLGFFVAWTPTLGFQIALYLGLASLMRVNKVVGVPILFISNPFTAVPLYYTSWRVGNLLLHGGQKEAMVGKAVVQQELHRASAPLDAPSLGVRMGEPGFWRELGLTVWNMGGELWVGGLLMGAATGAIGYLLCLRAVAIYRTRRPRRAPSS